MLGALFPRFMDMPLMERSRADAMGLTKVNRFKCNGPLFSLCSQGRWDYRAPCGHVSSAIREDGKYKVRG